MTLPAPHISFDKPIKVSDPSTDIYSILGLYRYFDSVLVCHTNGYTDIKWVSGDTRKQIEEKIKQLCVNP
jgi:hypothetical protein